MRGRVESEPATPHLGATGGRKSLRFSLFVATGPGTSCATCWNASATVLKYANAPSLLPRRPSRRFARWAQGATVAAGRQGAPPHDGAGILAFEARPRPRL